MELVQVMMMKKAEESRNGQGHQMIEYGKEVAQGTQFGEGEGESEVGGLQRKHGEEGVEIAIQEQEHCVFQASIP